MLIGVEAGSQNQVHLIGLPDGELVPNRHVIQHDVLVSEHLTSRHHGVYVRRGVPLWKTVWLTFVVTVLSTDFYMMFAISISICDSLTVEKSNLNVALQGCITPCSTHCHRGENLLDCI